MKIFLKELKFISTDQTYLKDITSDINKAISKTPVSDGFVFVNTLHTTLGIVINEIAEDYNAAAHIRALAFSHPSVVVPVRRGKLELGKYQQVAAFEFDGRDGKGKNPVRKRTIQIWICPAEKIIPI